MLYGSWIRKCLLQSPVVLKIQRHCVCTAFLKQLCAGIATLSVQNPTRVHNQNEWHQRHGGRGAELNRNALLVHRWVKSLMTAKCAGQRGGIRQNPCAEDNRELRQCPAPTLHLQL